MKQKRLTVTERNEIAEILGRRANDIASFKSDLEATVSKLTGDKIRFQDVPGSVDMAFSREIKRLRALADKIKVRIKDDEEED